METAAAQVLHGGAEKKEGKSAPAAAWEGGMKNLRDVYPGIVQPEGKENITQESGDGDQKRTSDLKEMLDFYEREVGRSLALCEPEQTPPEEEEEDATTRSSNPTTATTRTRADKEDQATEEEEKLLGPQTPPPPPRRDTGGASDGTEEEVGSQAPRPGLIKSLVVPLVAPLVTPLVSVVSVVGESTAAILVGRGEDTAGEKTAAEEGPERNEEAAAQERVVEPTTPPKEAPILGRVENLESQMDSLEEKQSPSGASEQQQQQQQPPRWSLLSLGSPPTPSSLEKRCRPAKDVLEETEVKGTLVERVQYLEQRMNQVVAPETVMEGGGISSAAAAHEEPVPGAATKEELGEKQQERTTAVPLVAQEEPVVVQGATMEELGEKEEQAAGVPVTSPTPIVTEPDEPSTTAALETGVPKEDDDEGVPVETEALDETVVETIIVPKPTTPEALDETVMETIIVPKPAPQAQAQVGEQGSVGGGAPQQQKQQQTANKGKKKHFQKLRAALRRLFKPKSAS